MNPIEKILAFIVEIEKLKDVQRKTRPVGLQRYENSAEHSWHVCLVALMLKDHANENIDIDRVIKMLLIHDLGEIDAGDTIIYASETQELKDKEAGGLKRLLAILPQGQGGEYLSLWYEFESGETPDAAFAKAIDRVPPLLHNLHGDGHSWREHGITKSQILGANSRIAKGSEALWSSLELQLEAAIEDGILES
ncbi:HD domain-containing protein [Shewanella sp. D64]|uniref:HD domain-containing protein n=1 Tax=unclassified Shewanella TaxID=196818 RepID=UPI0022BA3EA1|nr:MULTISPECIES: HD domain-containing protein [unclassified Shewanella]MEC4724370.1 HD domain-containing protein [Shewanella sp. D64]MEC4738882.1 HD domain-containing protein [Shewanella sp. E94]WBJ97681.1 HD domain-containing protein [Shewanella sp. MTB7]